MFFNACKSKRFSTEKILVLDKTLWIYSWIFKCWFFFFPTSIMAVYNLDKLVLHMMKSYSFAHFLPCDVLLLCNFEWDSA